MADMVKILHVSQPVYHGVIDKVLNAIMQNKGEEKQMNKIISFFREWSVREIFIAGFTVGRLAEMENQRCGRDKKNIFLNPNPDKEDKYADKPDTPDNP